MKIKVKQKVTINKNSNNTLKTDNAALILNAKNKNFIQGNHQALNVVKVKLNTVKQNISKKNTITIKVTQKT